MWCCFHKNYNLTWKSDLAPKKLSMDLLSIDRCERVQEAPIIAGTVAEYMLPPTPVTSQCCFISTVTESCFLTVLKLRSLRALQETNQRKCFHLVLNSLLCQKWCTPSKEMSVFTDWHWFVFRRTIQLISSNFSQLWKDLHSKPRHTGAVVLLFNQYVDELHLPVLHLYI